MKIDGLGARPTLATRGLETEHRTASLGSDFASELEDQQGDMTREQLEQMLEEIDRQGQQLTKTPTYDELKSYRSLIKNFVGTVVSQMYSVNTQAGWDRLGRQKVYTTVRKIDRELENMAEKIRLGQTDQLNIIASHDAIRGMLVDLYM